MSAYDQQLKFDVEIKNHPEKIINNVSAYSPSYGSFFRAVDTYITNTRFQKSSQKLS